MVTRPLSEDSTIHTSLIDRRLITLATIPPLYAGSMYLLSASNVLVR